MLRTHTCNEVRKEHIGQAVTVAGWVNTIRDHGGVIFIDLRDHFGMTQVVFHDAEMLKNVHKETVIQVKGAVVARDAETVNPKLETGEVEIHVEEMTILGPSKNMLPFEIESSKETREDVRLKYRYLDLRNPALHKNIVFRSQVISFLRRQMEDLGFMDFQTPILTSSMLCHSLHSSSNSC